MMEADVMPSAGCAHDVHSLVILVHFGCLREMPGHESERERPSEKADEDEQAHGNSSPLPDSVDVSGVIAVVTAPDPAFRHLSDRPSVPRSAILGL